MVFSARSVGMVLKLLPPRVSRAGAYSPRAMALSRTELSHAQARRIALYAQGFSAPRPTTRVDRRHVRRGAVGSGAEVGRDGGLEQRQEGARVPVLDGADHGEAPAR